VTPPDDPNAWSPDLEESRCLGCGRETCAGPSVPPPEGCAQPPHEPTRPRLLVRWALDEIEQQPPAAIVDGVAFAGGLTVLVSESGVGKTFVFLDLAAAVADDRAWMGRRVKGGSVVYVTFEGDAFGLRLQALRGTGRTLKNLCIVHASDPLSPRVTRQGEEERSIGECVLREQLQTLVTELATTGRPPIVLVIIDTVRASMTGSEDSSEHVAAYLRAVKRVLAPLPAAAGALAHHAGWQDGETHRKRERGSSAWRGNCDATIYLEAGDYDATTGDAALTMRTLKIRDHERPAPVALIRRRVELDARDEDGRPRTSCVIALDVRSPDDREAARGALQEAADRVLDARMLRAIHEHPKNATSYEKLRHLLGVGMNVVGPSISRLLTRRAIEAGARGQPYRLTDLGLVALHDSKK